MQVAQYSGSRSLRLLLSRLCLELPSSEWALLTVLKINRLPRKVRLGASVDWGHRSREITLQQRRPPLPSAGRGRRTVVATRFGTRGSKLFPVPIHSPSRRR